MTDDPADHDRLMTMGDQWPRYEVFKQEKESGPFRNVGSVHAPDPELALQNARDVFARRPACHDLWVVPAAAITTWNHGLSGGELSPPDSAAGAPQSYAVCAKPSSKPSMTYVEFLGCVEARSAGEALRLAAMTFGEEGSNIWWVFPEGQIGRSHAEESAGFEAATGKLFRLPNQYHTVFTMRKLRHGDGGET